MTFVEMSDSEDDSSTSTGMGYDNWNGSCSTQQHEVGWIGDMFGLPSQIPLEGEQ